MVEEGDVGMLGAHTAGFVSFVSGAPAGVDARGGARAGAVGGRGGGGGVGGIGEVGGEVGAVRCKQQRAGSGKSLASPPAAQPAAAPESAREANGVRRRVTASTSCAPALAGARRRNV